MNPARHLTPQLHPFKRPFCAQCNLRLLSTSVSQTNPPRPSRNLFAPAIRATRRNTGTKVRKSVEQLPQGLQTPLEPFVEKETSKYSPVIDEVLQNQRRFPKCILLTRVGQFYEVVPRSRTNNSYISPKQTKSRRY